MRLVFLFFYLFLSLSALSAQECYGRFMKEGKAAYEVLDFEVAIKKFEAARICPDRPEGEEETGQWLEKARNGYLDAIKAAKEETERKLAELTAANERITASMAETMFEQLHGLKFDEALETAKQISAFGMQKEALRRAFAEMAWVYNEAGKYEAAVTVVKESSPVWETPLPALGADTASWLTGVLSQLVGPGELAVFQNRYFPRMVRVEGGTFWMGIKGERTWEKPVHQVTLSDFELSATEVTAQQWFMYSLDSGKEMPTAPGWGWELDNPVVNVSWFDCLGYCNWLSQREGLPTLYFHDVLNPSDEEDDVAEWKEGLGQGYRLPTESEWEFAAGGGLAGRNSLGYIRHPYSGSNAPLSVAWFEENAASRTHAGGSLKANELGLFDMNGNVWEWCWDWYGNYPKDESTDPRGGLFSVYRAIRGGSWRIPAESCPITRRSNSKPFDGVDEIGFRIARYSN